MVVVAEDDDDMRACIVEVLRADDLDVVEAIDGADLLDCLLDPERYALVVADLDLPALSGFDAVAMAHEMSPDACATRLLIVTGDARASVDDEARALGAVGVMRKPLDLDDVRLAVKLLVSARYA